MDIKNILIAAAAILPVVVAQGAAYDKCGGIGFTGPTTCVAGYFCSYQNDYFSQCIPGVATTTASKSSSSSTKAATASTKISSTTRAPTSTLITSTIKSSTTAAPPVASGNPFVGYQLCANPYYASEVQNLAIPSLTGTLVAKASAVAKVPSFVWLDTAAKVPTMDTYLTNIEALNAAGASPKVAGAFVVYDLPDRDCNALASNGEYSIANGGLALYKTYIDNIAAIIKKHTGTKIFLVIEPDSLANLVTNLSTPKCAGAAAAYKEGTIYALQKLNLPNVVMYLDAGHAGWLGWASNIGPAATLFGQLYAAAGSPAAVRGLATNVANYNAWTGPCASYTQGDTNCNEKLYINALAPLLTAVGFPAHFITDTSRNGVQPTAQLAWGDWCNLIGTGFGVRPTTATDDPLEDAFVWVKPGGESDGTSNTTSVRFDGFCGRPEAMQNAPEAGTWFQAYFAQLLTNANPSF